MTAHVSTFAYHLCRLSILRMGTSTFLHPGSVSQGYGHTQKGHVYIILKKIKPARWHLCRISPLLPWESWRSLPASGSLRPKPQAQTKKGGSYPWLGRASAASTTVREKHPWCQPHPPNMPFCKTSNLPSTPFGGSLALWLIRCQQKSQHQPTHTSQAEPAAWIFSQNTNGRLQLPYFLQDTLLLPHRSVMTVQPWHNPLGSPCPLSTVFKDQNTPYQEDTVTT